VNTHKRVTPVIVLAVLAALSTVWLSGIGPAWAESPISPVSPLPFHSPVHPDPYVNECYRRCERWDQGNSTCYRSCRCVNGYESCAPWTLPAGPSPPYESGNYACWQSCIGKNPDRVEGFCLCKCGIEDNGTCSTEDLFMLECRSEGFSEEQCRAWHDKPPVDVVDEPPAPTATPVPVPVQQGCPDDWEELQPWMGMYVLRSNGTEYCIGPRLD